MSRAKAFTLVLMGLAIIAVAVSLKFAFGVPTPPLVALVALLIFAPGGGLFCVGLVGLAFGLRKKRG